MIYYYLFKDTVFQTILSGVFVFVASQYILKLLIEPRQNYLKVIAKIDNKLKFYSNVIVNPPFSGDLTEDYSAAKKETREMSCEIESCYKSLFFVRIFRLNNKNISEVAKNLIWLSNIIGHNPKEINLPLESSKRIEEIRKILKIQEL